MHEHTGPRTIGFIGTGNMGGPLIERLLDAGHQVQVHDVDPQRAQASVARGATWRGTPASCAAGCEIVVTCLPLPHHVLENLTGPDGALQGMSPGSVWIDTSTTDYHNTLQLAGLALAKGVYSLEAPVSNLSHMGVDFANVCFYIGGDKPGYRISRDVLETMGRKSFYVGRIGNGQSVKLLTNLLFYAATVAWTELLAIARHAQLPLHWLWDFVKTSRGNCFVSNQLTPFILDSSYDRSCTLEITVKDMGLTVALADELGVTMPLGRIVAQRYQQAGERYPSHDNHVKVAALCEEENHLSLGIENFQAPSPYGANPDYRHPRGLVSDHLGRVVPSLPDAFRCAIAEVGADQQALANALVEYLACVNRVILDEAIELGTAMGLEASLLAQVVNWSCGPSWVAEHLSSYRPCRDSVALVEQQRTALRLFVLEQIARQGIFASQWAGTPATPQRVWGGAQG